MLEEFNLPFDECVRLFIEGRVKRLSETLSRVIDDENNVCVNYVTTEHFLYDSRGETVKEFVSYKTSV